MLKKAAGCEPCKVAVIGGGAAGLTFSAWAVLLGAQVDLYESARLMHLQRGSWHRPLHPEIYTWPDETAFRPVSHLPLLGWATGSANEVATEIVSKFWLVKARAKGRLQVRECTQAKISKDGHLHVRPAPSLGQKPLEQVGPYGCIVIAAGFGKEKRVPEIPLNSYWRSDALDQPFLDQSLHFESPSEGSPTEEGSPKVAILGSGDGALIDLLRTCCPDTEQGAFFDFILGQTLGDRGLLASVRAFDRLDLPSSGRGQKVHEGYNSLAYRNYLSLRRIDKFLVSRRRMVEVHWLFKDEHPFDQPSIPINRFLVSRLMVSKEIFRLVIHAGAEIKGVERGPGGTQRVMYCVNGRPVQPLVCDRVLCRFGPETRRSGDPLAALFDSVANCFEDESLAVDLEKYFRRGDGGHKECHHPIGWPDDAQISTIARRLNISQRRKPILVAEFLTAFVAPSDDAPGKPNVYRLRIRLVGVDKRVDVRYALHPSEGNRSVWRVGIGRSHEQWVNTRNSYGLRVHTSDGREWQAGTILEALARGYCVDGGRLPSNARLGRSDEIPVRRVRQDGTYEDIGKQHWKDAFVTLARQSS